MKAILVARFGAIGDILMATPTLRALRDKYPQARLVHLLERPLGDVLRGLAYVDAVIEFDKKTGLRPTNFFPLAQRLRSERFDLYVNLQYSAKTALIGIASGARTRLVYRKDDGLRADGTRLHSVDNYLETLRPLGIDPAGCTRHLDFQIPAEATARIAERLTGLGIDQDATLVLVNPGASAASRQWPVESLAAFLDHARRARPDWRLALTGGPGRDQEIAAAVLARVERPDTVVDLVGKTSFKETGALLRRADAMVTMDTGPMHLAAAVGTPLVALFGPTAPQRTGPAPPPPNARRAVLPLALVHTDGLDCVPCMSRTCRRGDLACLVRQSPESVVAAVDRQLTGR